VPGPSLFDRRSAPVDVPFHTNDGLYVNGTAAIAGGKPTQALAGRVLRHADAARK
jgi:hypothetical protein